MRILSEVWTPLGQTRSEACLVGIRHRPGSVGLSQSVAKVLLGDTSG